MFATVPNARTRTRTRTRTLADLRGKRITFSPSQVQAQVTIQTLKALNIPRAQVTLVRTGGDQGASDTLYAGSDPMTAEDIAATVLWIAALPPHLNSNRIELMPVSRSFAGFRVARRS